MDITIRQGSESDRESLYTLDPACRDDRHRRWLLDLALGSSGCLVAETDGSIVGYALLTHTFYGNAMIEVLHVAENARRHGVGTQLVREAVRLSDTPKVFTSTNESNGPMRALLAAEGFEQTGTIHNLDEGDPELVFFRYR
ncbi:MAG: GNAT family N-acetyltransferase [Planctomycetota bacterium]